MLYSNGGSFCLGESAGHGALGNPDLTGSVLHAKYLGLFSTSPLERHPS